MDRAGHSYHIPCWYKEMEAEAEERRDQKARKNAPWTASIWARLPDLRPR
jgi:hypothetical protein